MLTEPVGPLLGCPRPVTSLAVSGLTAIGNQGPVADFFPDRDQVRVVGVRVSQHLTGVRVRGGFEFFKVAAAKAPVFVSVQRATLTDPSPSSLGFEDLLYNDLKIGNLIT